MKSGNLIVFVLYLVFAAYLVNSALNFIALPEFFAKADRWILLISGAFLVLGGLNFLKLKRLKTY